MSKTSTNPDLSIVLPVLNEAASLAKLYGELSAALATLELDAEIIFVNDGSSDDSQNELLRLAVLDSRLRLTSLFAGIAVRVMLHRQTAVSLFYFGLAGVLGHGEDFVIIALRHFLFSVLLSGQLKERTGTKAATHGGTEHRNRHQPGAKIAPLDTLRSALDKQNRAPTTGTMHGLCGRGADATPHDTRLTCRL